MLPYALNCPTQKSESSFILCSSSQAIWSYHLNLSLLPLVFASSATTTALVRVIIFTWTTATTWGFVLFCCFTSAHAPPSLHLFLPCQRSAFKTESTTYYVSLLLDSPFSYHILKAILPTRHSDTS